jgi:hypothetical protein
MFEVRCLHIPVTDRTPFEGRMLSGLLKILETLELQVINHVCNWMQSSMNFELSNQMLLQTRDIRSIPCVECAF